MSTTGLGALLTGVGAPNDPVVHVGVDTSVTRSELEAAADALAADLGRAGVLPGQAVAVSLPNGSDAIAALFGVWRAGAVHVPLNPRLTPGEQQHVLDAVRPAAIVTDGMRVQTRAGAATYAEDVALISMTSGTTGRPKPVLLRHDGVTDLLDGVIGTLRSGRANEPARKPMPNLVPVSLSLWAGIYQVLFAFRVGAPVVIMPAFDTREFARIVAAFGIRSSVLPPAAMVMLCDDESITDLAPLRYVRSISSPLSPLQARRFRDRFGIAVLNGWGQTEIGGEIVGWSAADSSAFGDAKLGSVGRPHRGVVVRAVDADGNDVPLDGSGELWVTTPALSAGYADGADLSDRLSPDGWFRTGDVGRVDADGFVWVEGRVSDMINRGGLKVFPAEVVEVLLLSPAIADAHVVGVPDVRLGEVPWAFVVASPGTPVPEPAVLEQLCREHLAPYKVPVGFVTVEALPRNEIGKVLGNQLVAMAPVEAPTDP
ncbi:MAG: AMP-dependent synthetase and ligase [Actinomycetia bacterium]|nr:AMP-dependent synthetase and ligase [Actinomycetes bacterium]